jgi:murein DD-endopeptidase MepM/ murein hydrolase activator NlpD
MRPDTRPDTIRGEGRNTGLSGAQTRSAEKASTVASLLPADTPARAGDRFGWPVGGRIISSYGDKPGGLHNDGINISAARGTPVRAAENGVVVYADDQLKGYGNLVLVRHADRWMTAYAHMDTITVKRGQVVKKGQKIGSVGTTGGVSVPQLHFEVRHGTEALNPVAFLAKRGS